MVRSLSWRPWSGRSRFKDGDIDTQRVELVKKTNPKISRFLWTFVITYCILETMKYMNPRAEENPKTPKPDNGKSGQSHLPKGESKPFRGDWDDKLLDVSRAMSNPSNISVQSPVDSRTIHLMLPIWVRQKKSAFYQASDIEWQNFAKLEADKKRGTEVRAQIVKLISRELRKPQHLANMRLIQYTNNAAISLEMIPPLYQPPAYEIPCLFLDPGRVRFGWRTVPDTAGNKLERIFHPFIFAEAFTAGLKEFTIATYLISKARLSDYLDQNRSISIVWDPRNRSAPNPEVVPTKKTSEEEKIMMKFPMNKIAEKDTKRILPFLRGRFGEDESRQRYHRLVRSMTYQTAIDHACSVFNHKWISGQIQALQTSPRGSCQFKGLIDCFGERGRYRLEVTAVFLPGENEIVGRPVITNAYVIADVQKWDAKKSKSVDKIAFNQSAPGKRPEPIKNKDESSDQVAPEEDVKK